MLSDLANAGNPSLLTRWMATASCPRSGSIRGSFMICRLPVRARFGKAEPMKRLVSVMAFAGALAACNGEEADEPAAPKATATVAATPTPTSSASEPPVEEPEPDESEPAAESPPGGARDIAEETEDFHFKYTYPLQAGRIAALSALLDRRLARERRELARDSAEARREARA